MRCKLLSLLLVSLTSVLTGCDTEPLVDARPASVLVKVVDESQAAVPGVVVQVISESDQVVAQGTTDATGRASFDVPAGSWRVRVIEPDAYVVPAETSNPQNIFATSRAAVSVVFALQSAGHVLGGTLYFGFETSAFLACREQRAWWFAGGTGARHVYDGWLQAKYQGVHEVWLGARGVISPPGRYGHLGGAEHEVRVSTVHDVREYRATDCPERRLSVAPRSTWLAIGDELRIDLATFDERGQRSLPNDVSWTSTDPLVASVENGMVVAHRRGLTRIIARTGEIADTSLIQVQWPWYMAGVASLRATVRNTDGSPGANVPVFLDCPGVSAGELRTDGGGNLAHLIMADGYSPGALSDTRRLACRLNVLVIGDTMPPTTFFIAGFSRAGVTAAPVHVEVLRTRPTGKLRLHASSTALASGSTTQINVTQGGVAMNNVEFDSVLPEVATVDPSGRVTARSGGSTFIVARSAADSTIYGWLEIRVRHVF
jgi:hypothetical protein